MTARPDGPEPAPKQPTTVEMKPGWWGYALKALRIGRETITEMHPETRAVHDLEVEDYDVAIETIQGAGIDEAGTWAEIEVTERDLQCIYEGLIDIHFDARDKAGGDWSDVTHDRTYKATEAFVRDAMDVRGPEEA